MQLILSWGYVFAAIASAVVAVDTGEYRLLFGIPIAIGALSTVTFAPLARGLLETASQDTAIIRPIRGIAWLLVRFSFMLVFLWPVAFALLLFNGSFVGAWLIGTYIVSSNTIRWYRAAYLPPTRSGALPGRVVPGETAAMLHGMTSGFSPKTISEGRQGRRSAATVIVERPNAFRAVAIFLSAFSLRDYERTG